MPSVVSIGMELGAKRRRQVPGVARSAGPAAPSLFARRCLKEPARPAPPLRRKGGGNRRPSTQRGGSAGRRMLWPA